MPKRGANGTLGTVFGQVLLSGDARHGYDVYYRDSKPRLGMGVLLGHIARGRHTVRTPYKGTRIGYDREHTCWTGTWEWGIRPKAMRFDSLRCYRTLTEVAGIMLREYIKEAVNHAT